MSEAVQATILVAELRGLLEIVRLLPSEDAQQRLAELFAAVTDVVVGYRGRIEKLEGEAVVLMFGHAGWSAGEAMRAVLTALELQRAVLGFRNRQRQADREEWGGLQLAVAVVSSEGEPSAVQAEARRLCLITPSGWVVADRVTRRAVDSPPQSEIEIDAWTESPIADIHRCHSRRALLRRIR